jgi:hypothetical protein
MPFPLVTLHQPVDRRELKAFVHQEQIRCVIILNFLSQQTTFTDTNAMPETKILILTLWPAKRRVQQSQKTKASIAMVCAYFPNLFFVILRSD